MENFEEQYCALCLTIARDGNFKEIQNVTKDILDILLLELNVDDRSNPVVCNICLVKVMEAFRFKSMCLYTDNTIIPYVDDETCCSVDLKEIYVKEKRNEQLINTLVDRVVCRLCLQLISGTFLSVSELNMDVIEKYIPEINFSVVQDPVLCRCCFDSVHTHSNFIKNCIELKYISQTESTARPWATSSISNIKHEIQIKAEKGEQETDVSKTECCVVVKSEVEDMQIKTECIEIKPESDSADCALEHEGISEVEKIKCKPKKRILKHKRASSKKIYTCEKCDYKTGSKKNLVHHQIVHRKLKTYLCDVCGYDAKKKSSLLTHQLQHKSRSEVDMFKCIYCDYETKYKTSLPQHIVVKHGNNLLDPEENLKINRILNLKDPLPMKLHKCSTCPYVTTNEEKFLHHQSRPHKKLTLNCNKCGYTTASKYSLKMHQVTHKDPSEVEMCKCHICGFETTCKEYLVRHQSVHKKRIQEQKYKCVYCCFESRHKTCLKFHIEKLHRNKLRDPEENLKVKQMLNFKNPFSLKTYKCDKCIYETPNKFVYRNHQLTHKNSSEVQMYKCDTCDYGSKYKRNLATHQLRHKSIKQVPTFKCVYCTFESRYKTLLKGHIENCHRNKLLDPEENSRLKKTLNFRNPFMLEKYECDKCLYATIYTNKFKRHQLIHKKRDLSSCKTRTKSHLECHKSTHKNSADVQMAKCIYCDNETEQSCLRVHMQIYHKKKLLDPEENLKVQRLLNLRSPLPAGTFKCNECDYETPKKRCLIEHMKRHRNPS